MAADHGDSEGQPGKTGGQSARNNGLENRLRQLDEKLASRRTAEQEKEAAWARNNKSGWANAVRLSSEFVAAVIVGVAIGWVLDKWVGTSPWGLIVFLLLGFAAGVVNVMRATGQMAEFGQQGGGTGDREK